ncbi:hypothetical protein EVB39_097 [Rhizobium phage RHph_TM3_3_9]|nr:hypothetical protein EVB39_097 [Rhizobium phage RHph_TM3_3_9]QIG68618.1 hypothetical protein EVB66_097 [Rhizobium phage RHph_TM3_3_13]QIG74476.1 hypothetical protein EVC09_096 [Rhizobium phage RHph_TM3_3_10]QXV74590.1 hypothetical protein [Rhizobium phage RHEph19]
MAQHRKRRFAAELKNAEGASIEWPSVSATSRAQALVMIGRDLPGWRLVWLKEDYQLGPFERERMFA